MKKIVIINGSGGVGKDEFVKQCSTFVPTINYSSIDKIKEIAKMCCWNGGKTDKDRKFLSDLKLLCSNYNDLPLKCMKIKSIEFKHSNYKLLFLHIREIKEIERAKKEFDATTLLITNSRVKHITSNDSDANVYNYKYDYTIDNCGTIEDLRMSALTFITQLNETHKTKENVDFNFDDIKVMN